MLSKVARQAPDKSPMDQDAAIALCQATLNRMLSEATTHAQRAAIVAVSRHCTALGKRDFSPDETV